MDPSDAKLVEAARLLLSRIADQSSQGPTMAELWESYYACDGKFLRSAKTVDYSWRLLCKVRCKDGLTLDQRRAMDITSDIVEELRSGLARSPFTGKPMRPASRNRNLYLVHRILNWSARNRKIPYVPIAPTRIEPEHNHQQTCIRTDDEFARLLSCIRHETLRAFVLTLFDSGMRFGEAIQVRRSQVVRRDGGGGVIELSSDQTKTGKPRHIYLTKRALRAMEQLPNRGPFVFASEEGKPYSYVYMRRMLEDAVDRSGIKLAPGERIRFHQMRHSFVARARFLFRWPQSRIMKQTGHTTTSMFLRYGDSDEAEMGASMDEIDNALPR